MALSMREWGGFMGLDGEELAWSYSRYLSDSRELPDDMDMFKQPEDFD